MNRKNGLIIACVFMVVMLGLFGVTQWYSGVYATNPTPDATISLMILIVNAIGLVGLAAGIIIIMLILRGRFRFDDDNMPRGGVTPPRMQPRPQYGQPYRQQPQQRQQGGGFPPLQHQQPRQQNNPNNYQQEQYYDANQGYDIPPEVARASPRPQQRPQMPQRQQPRPMQPQRRPQPPQETYDPEYDYDAAGNREVEQEADLGGDVDTPYYPPKKQQPYYNQAPQYDEPPKRGRGRPPGTTKKKPKASRPAQEEYETPAEEYADEESGNGTTIIGDF